MERVQEKLVSYIGAKEYGNNVYLDSGSLRLRVRVRVRVNPTFTSIQSKCNAGFEWMVGRIVKPNLKLNLKHEPRIQTPCDQIDSIG